MSQSVFTQRKLIIVAFVAILVILFFSLNSDVGGVPPEKQITVVFRFDDYSSLSSTEFEVKITFALCFSSKKSITRVDFQD